MQYNPAQPSHVPVAAHEPCHLLNPLKRKRRCSKRLHHNRHELHRIVIRRHTVGTEAATHTAPVNDRPLPVFSDPHRNRFHMSAAVRIPVAGLNIHMKAAQTVWTMIPVTASRPLGHYLTSAHSTRKYFIAGMVFIISLFK